MSETLETVRGSGNVFADLGWKPVPLSHRCEIKASCSTFIRNSELVTQTHAERPFLADSRPSVRIMVTPVLIGLGR